ncbi:glycoside hydrolase family 88 protein [Luteimonas sp. MC1750]|uniref:glycoside hydrolase family 88 protein n=1 Tax=Luteimonas sp. MC1750 TaxID=2799326 RepID=UPI0018F05F69|nr:glycoside hydrolase family 88 protein [Luteimonas sp. MC1750]MBJ6984223.1 glycoside hydrolase family 88 protein [Luteimonas sp. MC1750]QQO06990.1 glycoside hydrolase family 88 protein [Luteimonas sp. MC1750]
MIVGLLSTVILMQCFLIAYPIIERKLRQRTVMLRVEDAASIKSAVALAGRRMLSSRRVTMSFNDDESLYALLAKLKNRVLGRRTHHAYAYYNFPFAFLLNGLLDYSVATGDSDVLKRVESKSKEFIDEAGVLKFPIDKLDQATFGLMFLTLFELTKDDRYLTGARRIFEEMQAFKGEDGLYRYRIGLNVFFIDTVGLLCPFLVRYSQVAGVPIAMADAEAQVKFALANCVEPSKGLAIHAYDLASEQALGSVNWARGMGWLTLGLSVVAREARDPALMEAMRRYADILGDLREPYGYWPQFLGHTNDRQIDSSGTLMFLHAFQQCGIWNIDGAEVKSLAALCVDRRGRVVQSSGDTIYINKYSRLKGPSELSQGLMLSLLSGLKP